MLLSTFPQTRLKAEASASPFGLPQEAGERWRSHLAVSPATARTFGKEQEGARVIGPWSKFALNFFYDNHAQRPRVKELISKGALKPGKQNSVTIIAF